MLDIFAPGTLGGFAADRAQLSTPAAAVEDGAVSGGFKAGRAELVVQWGAPSGSGPSASRLEGRGRRVRLGGVRGASTRGV